MKLTKYVRKRKPTVKKVTKSIKTYVKKAISKNVETKFLKDSNLTYSNIVYQTATFVCLTSNLTQGDTASSIDGRKAKLNSLNFKYSVKYNTLPTDTTTHPIARRARLIIYQDNEFSEITQQQSTNLLTSYVGNDVDSLYNPEQVPVRYKILYNKLIKLDVSNNISSHSKLIKRIPLNITFQADPTGPNAVAKGHLYALIICDDDTQANVTYPISIRYDSYLYFKDS